MRSFRRVATVLLVVLLMAALMAPAALAKQRNKQVPLKGDFVGVDAEFSGNFSHLGRFTGQITSAVPTAEWTAANGDTVANKTTSFVVTGVSPDGGFFYEQEITITGGTGRFVDASGEATVTGTIDFDTGAYDGHLEGTISQPGPGN